ncbi:hypothetical protein [Novosphingobium sp. TH158]|uniref:hypothetical protein n=1 Tax=Novosphingobium sp. TH158 TaxID=2067455 RepID=UPI000C7ADF30|nr:hypothetical protein [Novosphingobium sp. TH158]PLK24309.1 hypothetical protein C0V78_13665 [Novosphingobium sp. TH158]
MKSKGPLLATGAAFLLVLPLLAPQTLAFPHRAQVGEFDVRSESPLPPGQLQAVLNDARQRIASSPLADPAGEQRDIYLTSGGWRWTWLTLQSRGAFALTRALTGYMVINRSDLATNRVENGGSIGGQRLLSGVIAHETCHGMLRRHFGRLTVDITRPAWMREGYCDHVAGESSLSDADVAGLKARGETHPALVYYHGRRRVAAILAANGGDVDKLFAGSR